MGGSTSSKAKYLWETDSEQVPWGKDEKYLVVEVKIVREIVKEEWNCS